MDKQHKKTAKINWQGIKKSLGPGLLMAAAAIGVSHLVQSTRAGATYGFAMIWAVVFANFFKYPFLEFGPRYAIATGESMIEGYKRLGDWAIGIYAFFTIATMFIIQAAVTVVSASLAAKLTGIALSPLSWSIILLVICVTLLMSGEYSVLDGAIKFIMVVLAISAIIALVAAFATGGQQTATNFYPDIWDFAGVSFLIALMGWMPIPIDSAAWHSLWSLEREKQTQYKPKLKESLLDFNIGYIGAATLALIFLLLGALVMFGSGEEYASSGAVFSGQLISLFTDNLGRWSYPVITVCAFTTMFSTTLTVTDAYPRVCSRMLKVIKPDLVKENDDGMPVYRFLLVAVSLLSVGVLYFLGEYFTLLIDLATTLSFLTAPILAYINYRLVTADHVPEAFQPAPWLRWLSYGGFIFLTGFALLFFYWQIQFG